MRMSDSLEQQQTQASDDLSLNYWLDKWQTNKIGFHRSHVSKLFSTHLLPKLVSSEKQQCVVFSLCGKTLDMKAVLDIGHQVIGIEGSQSAVEAFFNENNIPHKVGKDESNQFQVYKGTDHPVTIYCGDFFAFNQSLSRVDYIWDRGGLVAINPSSREQYRDTLYRMMTPEHTRLFLVAIGYDDPDFTAPPNIVTDDEVSRLFGSKCSIEFLEAYDETEEFNARGPSKTIRFIEERIHLIVENKK